MIKCHNVLPCFLVKMSTFLESLSLTKLSFAEKAETTIERSSILESSTGESLSKSPINNYEHLFGREKLDFLQTCADFCVACQLEA